MFIETALIEYLKAQTAITVYVGDRIYFGAAPQSVAKPYIVITKVSSPGEHTQDGPLAIGNPHFQIIAYSLTYAQAHQIAATVKTALDGYQGNMGITAPLYVFSCFYDDESDDVYTELTPTLYSVIQDYYIAYQEA